MIGTLVNNIKRAETPGFAKLKGILKSIMRCNFIPSWKPLHLLLYQLHVTVAGVLNRAYHGLWCVPAFQAKCWSHGKGLNLPCGMPLVLGNLRIELGDDVSILDSTLSSGHLYDYGTLKVGSRVTIGYHSDISAYRLVEIGDDVMIAKDCFIADNDSHPLSPARRARHDGLNENEVKPVKIGNNVWIATGVVITKGVTIGDGSIIGANSVVTGYVEPNSFYAGVPAKKIKYIGDDERDEIQDLMNLRIHT